MQSELKGIRFFKSTLFISIFLVLCIALHGQADSTRFYILLQEVNSLQDLISKQQSEIDSLQYSFFSSGYVKSSVDEYYKDIDWYYKQVNTFVAIIGLLFTIVNITIIVLGSLSIRRIREDAENLKKTINSVSSKTEDRTNSLTNLTSNIILGFNENVEKLKKDNIENSDAIKNQLHDKEIKFKKREQLFEKRIAKSNESIHEALALFIDKLVSINYKDRDLQRKLQAISNRIELMSFDPEKRQMAILALAYTGDESDRSLIEDIINDKNEDGDVRLAAREAVVTLDKRLEKEKSERKKKNTKDDTNREKDQTE